MPVEPDAGNNDEAGDVIGCSVRGQKNIENDVPCQDSNERKKLPGQTYVIAAADGLGSARLSHVGSNVVTQSVVKHIEEAVTETEFLSEGVLQSVLRDAFVHARNRLHEVANSREVAVSDLNTTLLVAVGGPAGVGGAAVGDGGIVWHRGGRTGLLVPREDTEYGNKTIPLQSDNWTDSYRFGWMPDADAAAVFSDGLDGVAWDGPASVSDELFDQVFDNVAEFSDLDRLERFLADFLDGETLRESSRDDKTLVIGALPTAEWSDPEVTDLPESVRPRNREMSGTDHSKTSTGLASDNQTDSGSRRRTSPRTRERSLETATVDERLGSNQTRLVAGAGGIVAVVLVVFAAVLLTGGGGGTAGLNLSTAELQGEEGLVIQGSVGDEEFNDSLNLTVRLEGQGNESLIARHNNTSVTDGQFEFSLEPEQLENTKTELYHGKTTYRVVVETDDGMTGNTALDRGEHETVAIEPASFRVAIQPARDTVAGENLTVTVSVENVDDVEANRTVELDVDSLGNASKNVTLPDDESTVLNLSVATAASDAGNYTANVSVADGDTETVNVTVQEDTQGGESECPTEQSPVGGAGRINCANLSVASTGEYLFAQVTDRSDQYGPSRGEGTQ